MLMMGGYIQLKENSKFKNTNPIFFNLKIKYMKKISLIKVILVGVPLIGGTIMTTACDQQNNKQNKFDSFDLSTWNNKEKSTIINALISTIKDQRRSDDDWAQYVGVGNILFSDDLTKAFQTINPKAIFGRNNFNMSWRYVNDQPLDATIVKDVFKKGLLLAFQGLRQEFRGKTMINFQGSL